MKTCPKASKSSLRDCSDAGSNVSVPILSPSHEAEIGQMGTTDTARTPSQMSIDTHVPSSTTQTLPLPVRDVLPCPRIPVLFRHTEIYDVDDVGVLRRRTADEEVVRFDVSVDQVLFVDGLYTGELEMK